MICSYNHVRAAGNRNQTNNKGENHTIEGDFRLTVSIFFLDSRLSLHILSLPSFHIQPVIYLLFKFGQNSICSTRYDLIILLKRIRIR